MPAMRESCRGSLQPQSTQQFVLPMTQQRQAADPLESDESRYRAKSTRPAHTAHFFALYAAYLVGETAGHVAAQFAVGTNHSMTGTARTVTVLQHFDPYPATCTPIA